MCSFIRTSRSRRIGRQGMGNCAALRCKQSRRSPASSSGQRLSISIVHFSSVPNGSRAMSEVGCPPCSRRSGAGLLFHHDRRSGMDRWRGDVEVQSGRGLKRWSGWGSRRSFRRTSTLGQQRDHETPDSAQYDAAQHRDHDDGTESRWAGQMAPHDCEIGFVRSVDPLKQSISLRPRLRKMEGQLPPPGTRLFRPCAPNSPAFRRCDFRSACSLRQAADW